MDNISLVSVSFIEMKTKRKDIIASTLAPEGPSWKDQSVADWAMELLNFLVPLSTKHWGQLDIKERIGSLTKVLLANYMALYTWPQK